MNFEIWQWAILVIILTPSTILDIKKHEINLWLVTVGLLTGILLRTLLCGMPGLGHFIVPLIPGIIMIIVACLAKGCIGIGDGLMCLFLGSVLSFTAVIISIFSGFLVASAFGMIMLLFKKMNRKSEMPFIPFMYMGVIICGIV